MKKIIVIAIAVIFLSVSCGKKFDENAVRLYANANELYAAGRFSETVQMLDSVKKFVPALTLRAKSEYFMGDLNRAEKTFRQAIKSGSGTFESRFYLAKVLHEKGDETKARELTEKLMADNAHDPRLLRFAASLAMEQGDLAGASVLLDKAAELSSDGAMVLLDRARLRWIAGKGQEALEDLSRARAMLPWDTALARSINNLENRIMEEIK